MNRNNLTFNSDEERAHGAMFNEHEADNFDDIYEDEGSEVGSHEPAPAVNIQFGPTENGELALLLSTPFSTPRRNRTATVSSPRSSRVAPVNFNFSYIGSPSASRRGIFSPARSQSLGHFSTPSSSQSGDALSDSQPTSPSTVSQGHSSVPVSPLAGVATQAMIPQPAAILPVPAVVVPQAIVPQQAAVSPATATPQGMVAQPATIAPAPAIVAQPAAVPPAPAIVAPAPAIVGPPVNVTPAPSPMQPAPVVHQPPAPMTPIPGYTLTAFQGTPSHLRPSDNPNDPFGHLLVRDSVRNTYPTWRLLRPASAFGMYVVWAGRDVGIYRDYWYVYHGAFLHLCIG